MENNGLHAAANFDEIILNGTRAFISQINDADYEAASQLILDAEASGGRVHVTGIGKPGHIAGYIASLLSSTGTASYFLDGTEAVHGSSGQLRAGDVVICISNSGETSELLATVHAIKNNDCVVIAVTGNPNSSIARLANVHLLASVGAEGGELNRAPRASVLAQTFVLQRLSVILQSHKGLTPEQYVKWHPGGALGQLRDDEK